MAEEERKLDDFRRNALRQCVPELKEAIIFSNIRCYLEDEIHLSKSEVEKLECTLNNEGNSQAVETLLLDNFRRRIRYWPEFLRLLRKANYHYEAALLDTKLAEIIKSHGSDRTSRSPAQNERVSEGGAISQEARARRIHAMESGQPTSTTDNNSNSHFAEPCPGEKWQAFYLLDTETFDQNIGVDYNAKVGEGVFGEVLKARKKFRLMDVVVKTERSNSWSQSGKQFTMEKESAHVKHPYILPVVAMCEHSPRKIVSPYMVNGDLEHFITNKGIQMEASLRITHQLWEAVRHLHRKTIISGGKERPGPQWMIAKKQIVHRDIAPRNIMLDENLNVRLGDLGWSRHIADDMSSVSVSSGVVNQAYCDPDALKYMEKSKPQHDVYSVGLIMLRLLTLKSIKDIHRVLRKCENKWAMIKEELNHWVDQTVWTSVSEEYLDVAIGCLKPPDERKTAADLCVVLQDLMKENKFELFRESEDSTYRKMCISCLMNPRVNISVCLDSQTCIFYCKGCLVNRFANPFFCPSHGVDGHEPIGSENWFLLAIGGHSYKLCDPENMFYRDAERVCNIFKHHAVCGIRKRNVQLCCQQRNNLTSDGVVSELQKIVQEMNKNVLPPARGRLIIFYSGHGHFDGGLKLTQEEHLKPDQLKTALLQMECPADVLIFIDCCYAAKQELSFDLLPSDTSGIQISSCNSREISKSGHAGDCHSQFTDALISCLSSRPKSCPQNCHKCEDDKKAIVNTGFIDLDFLKSYLGHRLPIKPTCKAGEHYCGDILLAYECHSEIVDHLVDFVDSRDSNDIITKRVYITEKDFEEVKRQTTVDQLKEFKKLVLDKHAQYYVKLPDNDSKPENYTLYSSWEKELETFDDLSKLLKIEGIPTMMFDVAGK